MDARRAASILLSWSGLALLAAAAALLLAPRGRGEGFEDLGRFTGGLLLAALGGLASGASLLLARAAAPPWRVALGAAGCVAGALASAALLSKLAPSLPTGAGPAAFALAALLVALGGLARAVSLRRSAAA